MFTIRVLLSLSFFFKARAHFRISRAV